MKSKHIRPHGTRNTPAMGNAFPSCILLSLSGLSLLLAPPSVQAGSATWLLNPANGNWNTAGNWTPATVPNATANVATFGTSNTTSVSLSASTTVNGIVFNSGASAFTITMAPTLLNISGAGITNNSGIIQSFVVAGDSAGNRGALSFSNSATAGSDTAFTANGGNNGSFGGSTRFSDTATAANGTFTANGSSVSGVSGGSTYFTGNSTAANGTFITNGGTASSASGGSTYFTGNSTAANGTFTTNGGTASSAFGGSTYFTGITTAAAATLIANGGTGGGSGGQIRFLDDSTGGTARVEVFGNGSLSISSHNAPGASVGSIEGTGTVSLGSKNLTVGGNDLSTTFSGVASGSGGSLTKTGTGTLTLSGTNTYTGATTVSAGALVINGAVASTSVVVDGKLSGSGVMADATLSGSGSINPGNSPGIMTAAATNPTGGLDYNFEFTVGNTPPTWNAPSASGNDVLRLTTPTPFTASLSAVNDVNIYLNAGALTLGEVFTGGFYTDSNAAFLSSISSGTFTYLVAEPGGAIVYNGTNYGVYSGPLSFSLATVSQPANFGAGLVNGYTMQFTVVPEPTVSLLGGLGLFALLRRRRN